MGNRGLLCAQHDTGQRKGNNQLGHFFSFYGLRNVTLKAVIITRMDDPFRAIVEATVEYALYFVNADGTIQTWSAGCQHIHGYTAEDVLGQHIRLLYREQDRSAGVPEAELYAAAENGTAPDRRWMVRKDGTEFWAEGVLSAVRSESGDVSGFARVTRDASERRRLEQALERSTDELHRFAFTVSHDLQEPLRNVGNYAELLARRYKGQLDADADDFIKYILDGTARMTQLLQDILAYSQAGREDRLSPAPAQSANILQWALMQVDGLVKETRAVITYDALPSVRVDQAQLASVFQQLLGNSIKFRGEEPPHIHISARPSTPGMWEISVQDNGVGVEPQHMERIFGIFKRLHGREIPGTGIGLAICRKIVEAHGGRIWMESRPKQGATVKFTLPAA
jgi:PAS domain S-box-containing protein